MLEGGDRREMGVFVLGTLTRKDMMEGFDAGRATEAHVGGGLTASAHHNSCRKKEVDDFHP